MCWNADFHDYVESMCPGGLRGLLSKLKMRHEISLKN